MRRTLILFFIFQIVCIAAMSQDKKLDTVITTADTSTEKVNPAFQITDSTGKVKHSPRKAALRSALIPGWGQAYNKKYWKIPIVYTAIGIPVGTFLYNRKWYQRTRQAAKMLGSDPPDTANYRQRVNEQLYVFFSTPNALPSLLNYRNEFRRNMDYSILFALLFWGLNVVDATVDAHLKDFDVSDNLSLRIKPTILSGTTTAAVSFVFTIGKNNSKSITSR